MESGRLVVGLDLIVHGITPDLLTCLETPLDDIIGKPVLNTIGPSIIIQSGYECLMVYGCRSVCNLFEVLYIFDGPLMTIRYYDYDEALNQALEIARIHR